MGTSVPAIFQQLPLVQLLFFGLAVIVVGILTVQCGNPVWLISVVTLMAMRGMITVDERIEEKVLLLEQKYYNPTSQ